MRRRELLAATGTLIAITALRPSGLASDDDSAAIKQVIESAYETFYTRLDKQEYRAMLTDDYLLLENGEIMDASADIAAMPAPEDEYKRTDRFDFRSVSGSKA